MSASIKPTLDPDRPSATARFTATVDLPTPPLPIDTAMIRPRFGYAFGVVAAGRAGAFGAASKTGSMRREVGGGVVEASFGSTRTSVMPSTAATAAYTSRT